MHGTAYERKRAIDTDVIWAGLYKELKLYSKAVEAFSRSYGKSLKWGGMR